LPHSKSTTVNIPSTIEDLEYVDVRDEIMLMKNQFDKLLEVLDDDLLPKRPSITIQLFVVMGISMGHLLDGTVLAYTNVAMTSMESTFPDQNSNMKDFIYGMDSFGAALACLLAGSLMSMLGRRGSTMFCTIPCYTLGYVLIGCANGYPMIIVGRFLTGMGLGLTLTIPNVYIVEVTDPHFRGVLGVLPNLFVQLGIFITYVMGQWLDWSHLAFTFAGFNALFLVAVYYIPESPTHLINKGQEKEAVTVLKKLDIDLSVLDTVADNKKKGLVSALFSKNYKPFISGLVLMTFFMATAYPILIGNNSKLFKEAGLSIDSIASVLVGMAAIVFSMATIPLAKHCDRKTLLGISALGVSASLFTLGAFFYIKTFYDGFRG